MSVTALQDLEHQWQSLAKNILMPAAQIDAVWREIVRRYGENGRTYHTLTHINHVLKTSETWKGLAEEWTAVQAAIWFHDIIYNPQRSDNEEQSAALAAQRLQNCRAINLAKVQQLILATKSHQSPHNNDYFILLDADLAILGAPVQEYLQYAQAIRQEYAFVPEEGYRNGRVQLLRQFLNRPTIYHIPQIQNLLESAARKNIESEINQLQNR